MITLKLQYFQEILLKTVWHSSWPTDLGRICLLMASTIIAYLSDSVPRLTRQKHAEDNFKWIMQTKYQVKSYLWDWFWLRKIENQMLSSQCQIQCSILKGVCESWEKAKTRLHGIATLFQLNLRDADIGLGLSPNLKYTEGFVLQLIAYRVKNSSMFNTG